MQYLPYASCFLAQKFIFKPKQQPTNQTKGKQEGKESRINLLTLRDTSCSKWLLVTLQKPVSP
jgi:hypothetical protein